MIGNFFHTALYTPLYNGLILLTDVLPGANIGLAVIAFTIIVRLILFPLSKKAVQTQMQMRVVQPELAEIKKRYEKDPQEYAKKTMEIYRTNGINPFASIFFLLLQLPIIITLYYVFYRAGFPTIHTELLYSFIEVPTHVSMFFLGLDIAKSSIILAILAAFTTFVQTKLTLPPAPKKTDERSFTNDLARSMNVQMTYVMPVIIFFIAWKIAGVVALYWFTSNLFTIGQELYMRKVGIKKHDA